MNFKAGGFKNKKLLQDHKAEGFIGVKKEHESKVQKPPTPPN